MKSFIKGAVEKLGYEIRKIRPPIVPINIRPMVLVHRVETRKSTSPFFFMQIGAHDGSLYDPIRQFVTKYHWHGILVEPQPKVFARLVENYRTEPQLIFENVALGKEDGEAILYAFKPGDGVPHEVSMLASFNREALTGNAFGYHGDIDELRVPTMTAGGLLSKHGVTELDLLMIDTEGFDYEVVKMFMNTGIRPAIICYESACLAKDDFFECIEFLTSKKYRVLTIGVDTIACRDEDDDDDSFRMTTEALRDKVQKDLALGHNSTRAF